MRGWLIVLVTPIALIAAILAYFTVRAFDEPTPTRNYAAEFNEQFQDVPEDQRAWPLYKQAAIQRLAIGLPREFEFNWPIAPGQDNWDEAVAVIESFEPVLETVRKAAQRPILGRELTDAQDPDLARAAAAAAGVPYQPGKAPSENPMLVNILLPELRYLRSFARDLAVDSYVAAEQGDGQRAASDLETMLALAAHARQPATLIGQLVQFAIETLAQQQLSTLMTEYPDLFSPEQLASLQRAFLAMGQQPPEEGITHIGIDLSFERLLFYDMLQRCYTDDGHGDGHLTLKGMKTIADVSGPNADDNSAVRDFVATFAVASRRQTRDKYDAIMNAFKVAAAKRPWDRTPGELSLNRQVAKLKQSFLGELKYPLITLLVPALNRSVAQADLTDARRDAAITLLAIARFQAETGELPARLEDLVPAYLPALPRDPVDGQPLRFAHTDSGFTLYSIGFDQDDDGGRPCEVPDDAKPFTPRTRKAGADGDWVLFPTPIPDQPGK